MWKNALFASTLTVVVIFLGLLSQMQFLVAYKRLLTQFYWQEISVYFGLLWVNFHALYFLLTRKLFSKDAGRRLSHLEKQFREGNIVDELPERLSIGE